MKISTLLLLFCSFYCKAQFQIIDSVSVKNVVNISVDRQDNVYTGDIKGNIQKYDINLKALELYSPERKGEIAILECWNPLRLFASFSDLQEFIYLDRFLVNENRFKIEVTPFAGLIAPALDNNIWLIDYSSFALKKLDLPTNQIVIDRPLDLLLDKNDYELSHMKEYQNLLFISDKKTGIMVFDNLGNFLYKFKGQGIESFNFIDGNIYYLLNGRIIVSSLYNDTMEKLELDKKIRSVIITKKFYFFLTEKWLFKAVRN